MLVCEAVDIEREIDYLINERENEFKCSFGALLSKNVKMFL